MPFWRRTQYPVRAEPIPPPPATIAQTFCDEPQFSTWRIYQSIALTPFVAGVAVSSWVQPLSEPPVKVQRPVAQQQDLAWNPSTPEIITVDKWHQPLATPAPPKPGLSAAQQQFVAHEPFTFVDIGWFNPLTERNVKVKAGLPPSAQQSLAWSTFTPEVLTWHQPFSEPSVKTKRGLAAASQQPLAWLFAPETVTVDKWFQNFSEPSVKSKLGLRASAQQTLAWEPFTFGIDIGWYQALSEPSVKVKKPVAQQPDLAWGYFTPEVLTWYQPFSEPSVKAKQGLSVANQQSLAWVFAPETVTPDKWWQPLAEPSVKSKQGLRTAAQQALAWEPFTFGIHIGWDQPLSEPPVKVKKPVAQQQELAWSTFTPEVLTWYQPLSERNVKVRAGLLPSAQQFLAQIQFTETVTVDKWHRPLSERLYVKSSLAVSQQQAVAHVPFVEVVTEDKWHQGWPNFATRRIQPHPAYQQTLATWLPTETVTPDKWYQRLAEPVRVKRGLRPEAQQFLAWEPFTFGIHIGWHQPWSEPKVKVKIGLAVANQPFAVVQPPKIDISIGWFAPLAEPTTRPKLHVSLQLPAARPPFVETVTEDKWHYPWSDPPKRNFLPTSQQQDLAFVAPQQVVYPGQWLTFLAEPVRVRLGLLPSAQQFLAHCPFEEFITEDKWHEAWSEPVRFRHIPTALIPARIECPPHVKDFVTLDLHAIETGDIFSGSINILYCFHTQVSVVEEVVPDEAKVGIPVVEPLTSGISVQEAESDLCAFQNNAFQNNAFQVCTSDGIIIVSVAVVETC